MSPEDKVRGWVRACGGLQEASPRKFAVTVLVFNSLGKVLSVSRGPDDQDIGLPGGKVERGETLFEAAVRETWEETGLIVQEPAMVDIVHCGVQDGFYCVTFLTKVEGESETPVSSLEGHAAWVSPPVVHAPTCTYREYNKRVLGVDDDE